MGRRKKRADGRTNVTLREDLYDMVQADARLQGRMSGEVSTRGWLDTIVEAYYRDIPWQRLRELGPAALEETDA